MEELKPCPFCRTEAEIREGMVRCPLTRCVMFNKWIARQAWNTRPIEDALYAELVHKEAIINELNELAQVLDDTHKEIGTCLRKTILDMQTKEDGVKYKQGLIQLDAFRMRLKMRGARCKSKNSEQP